MHVFKLNMFAAASTELESYFNGLYWITGFETLTEYN